ncbi:MAG TPA: hypothetical protein VL098_03755 [Flavipsychrobacter sp.]|nr:hypothetical protein [Flavipsychrobacter sp.]
MLNLVRKWIFLVPVLLSFCANAQKDSSFLDNISIPERYKFFHGIFEDAKNSIRKDQFDTTNNRVVLLTQSEESFKRYEGKIIRHIMVKRYDFERTFSDTSKRIQYFGTRILNSLHTNTRPFVIRNNLFIRENTKLDAYKLADNERYLRNLDFIQDVRIIITPTDLSGDSVDVIVISKDLFSLKVFADVVGFNARRIRARISESNLGGTAQSLQVAGLWERSRSPSADYQLVYGKNNIGGSFVNGNIGYSRVDGGRSEGNEEEYSSFVRLNRPLVSPFSQLAGGMEVSFNHAVNVYKKPDSSFFDYRYNLYDFWAGINLGVTDIREGIGQYKRRDRIFVSARFTHTDFLKTPFQIGDRINPIYNDRQLILGQITFFRQEYFKMNYLYGFGNTEDIPTGYNVALTAGWHRQLYLQRPYTGFEIDKYIVTARGGFLHGSVRAGAFYRNRSLEDASFLVSGNYFSALIPFRKWKIRQQFRASYTQLDHRNTSFPLFLNNAYGPPNFNSGNIFGDKRLSAYTESVLYLNKKIFGFLFAPFTYISASALTAENKKFLESGIYPGLGGGVRTRNENLIFGTVEFKALYFPRQVPGLRGFQFYINSDIRFRYRTNFVKAPDVIQLNFEDIY